ncbi:Protopine 6-monooxygenase [Vitis vinifera]|uniref:Protopine 6-monooxygenase n=1 Tax=Vitis vinifera TaxID=29760 RepID=A0A438FEI7_VITVI|nr:Protopine 6-monooxygenase [Vitis vinifera]
MNNPSTLKRAQDELDIKVGKHRQVDGSDIKNLVYFQAIVKETLRLYPLGHFPCHVRPWKVALWLASHPSWDAPFGGQNLEFLPFGSGRRVCPGISFALEPQEITVFGLLATICLLLETALNAKRNKIKEGKRPPELRTMASYRSPPSSRSRQAATSKLGDMADKYGPIFCIHLGLRKALVVSRWEVAKECYTTNDKREVMEVILNQVYIAGDCACMLGLFAYIWFLFMPGIACLGSLPLWFLFMPGTGKEEAQLGLKAPELNFPLTHFLLSG